MTTVDELFDRFRAAYRAGEEADPRSYLDRVCGLERRELETLIDAFLAQDPGRPYESAALADFTEDPARLSLRRSVDERLGAEESWRTLLRAARNRAELPRSTVVARLAAALGVGGKEQKVAAYYHQMEMGTLPARGVSDRVLDALSRIFGVSAETLRAAGQRLTPPPPASPSTVFARKGQAAPAASAAAAEASPPEDWDEVDELFRGGG